MKTQNVKMALLLMAVGVAAYGIGGCAGSNPEAVLEGKWLVATDNTSLLPYPAYLTFNSNGEITQVQFSANGNTVIIDTSSGLRGDANVDGQNLTIGQTWGTNSVMFTGTFNDNFTVAAGQLTIAAEFGNIQILFLDAPATLTKQ